MIIGKASLEGCHDQGCTGTLASGATAQSIGPYDEAVRAFCLVYGDPVGKVDDALKISPDFAIAHLAKAWMFALTNDPGMIRKAVDVLDAAESLSINEREGGHRDALKLAVGGSRRAAVAVLDRLLMSYPRDILAHMAVAFLDVYLGRMPLERDRGGRALPFWSKDEAGYGIVLGLHGFGLEEAGEYDRARTSRARQPISSRTISFRTTPSHTSWK